MQVLRGKGGQTVLAIGQPIHDRAWADDVTAVAFAHEDAETSVAAAAAAVRPERRGVLV